MPLFWVIKMVWAHLGNMMPMVSLLWAVVLVQTKQVIQLAWVIVIILIRKIHLFWVLVLIRQVQVVH